MHIAFAPPQLRDSSDELCCWLWHITFDRTYWVLIWYLIVLITWRYSCLIGGTPYILSLTWLGKLVDALEKMSWLARRSSDANPQWIYVWHTWWRRAAFLSDQKFMILGKSTQISMSSLTKFQTGRATFLGSIRHYRSTIDGSIYIRYCDVAGLWRHFQS